MSIRISGGGGGGSQTPWTSDINGGGFILFNTMLMLIDSNGVKWLLTIDTSGSLVTTKVPAITTDSGNTLITDGGDRIIL